MVVHQQLAAIREARQRQHALHVAARDDARRLHDARRRSTVQTKQTSRPPARRMADRGSRPRRPARGAPGLAAHVLSGFFLAAGKSTLLRISR
jgi:hypothetical protein